MEHASLGHVHDKIDDKINSSVKCATLGIIHDKVSKTLIEFIKHTDKQ